MGDWGIGIGESGLGNRDWEVSLGASQRSKKNGVAQLRDDRVGAIQRWLPQNSRGGGHWGTAPTTGSSHECATPKKL